MGTRNFKIGRSVRALSRAASICVLSFAIVLMPLTARADGLASDVAQYGNAATNAAGNAGSTLTSLKTAADSGNNMAAGSKQMKCCKEGCDGAGKKAAGDTAAENGMAASEAAKVPGAPSTPSAPSAPAPQPFTSPRPAGSMPSPANMDQGSLNISILQKFASLEAPAKMKVMWDLLRPQKVEAMAGCNDGMMAMAQAAMQMLSALAGLAAAAMAANNASKSNTNAANLGPIANNMPGTTPDVPKVVGPTDLGNQASGASAVAIDPSLLRSGKVGASFDQFEKNFGIPRDTFANSLLNGGDPRQMLMNAPKNPISAADMNMAFAAAKNMSQEQKDAALASQMEFAREQAAKIAAASAAAGEISSSGGKSPNKTASSKELDELDLLGADRAPASAQISAELSPELQAALAEKDAAQVREGTSIFQIVHEKYQQRVRMIFGFDAHGKSIGGKGVADANGF